MSKFKFRTDRHSLSFASSPQMSTVNTMVITGSESLAIQIFKSKLLQRFTARRSEYTTLVEVNDRIFSTSVDLTYEFAPIKISTPADEKKLEFVIPIQKGEEGYIGSVWDDEVPIRARTATLETFALDDSASVQVRRHSPYDFLR
jgi:hypothetical protein